MANSKMTAQEVAALAAANGLDAAATAKLITALTAAGGLKKASVARLVTSSKYPHVYLDLDQKWVRLNSGPVLTAEGKAKLTGLRDAINAVIEAGTVEVLPEK